MVDQFSPKPGGSKVAALSSATSSHVSHYARRLLGASSVQSTARLLRSQIWAWPIIAAIVFGGAGWWVHRSVESAMREQRISELTTILNADVAALEIWIADQKATAELMAEDDGLKPLVQELLQATQGEEDSARRLTQAPAQAAIRKRLEPKLRRGGYVGFMLATPDGIVLAADQDPPVGHPLLGYRHEFFRQVADNAPAVSIPYRSPLLLSDEHGDLRANLPTMLAAAAIRDDAARPAAVLALRVRPDDAFTKILRVAQWGETGETYAFNAKGLLLSQSRFDDDLKRAGLLVDQTDVRSVLTVELRDPGVNLMSGERPARRPAQQPLTEMAAAAVQGRDGFNADGYRDYRGVPVVGVWRWLKDYNFGVATEIDVAEAFQPVYILRRSFWILMGLLGLSALAIYVGLVYMSRQQRALQAATVAAKKLGQYTLELKIGAGGMGTVYKARHAMLRRPTAVKLLNAENMSESAIARFEREVQLTSALTHPNTIAIFDYGRTPDGLFYYAMEYLEGMNLDDLVVRFGPLSESRVVHILRQVCGSLAEAHSAGLIHRDIKPANIILTHRGGLHDFVKVLDFGLVKSLEGQGRENVTMAGDVAGTPLYLPPEAIEEPEQVNAASDVYAIGAVGYFLLTGSPVFTGKTIAEICLRHVRDAPTPPSARLGRQVDADLEALILRCLAKSQADRPANAAVLVREFANCTLPDSWTADAAEGWWTVNCPAREPEPNLAVTLVAGASTHENEAHTTMAYQPK